MKVRIQEAGSLGILRCPIDDETLLTFNEDDINLKDCQHFHWHLGPDEKEINKEDEKSEDEEEDSEEEEWNEVLVRSYIVAISVEGGKFYLLPVKPAKEG